MSMHPNVYMSNFQYGGLGKFVDARFYWNLQAKESLQPCRRINSSIETNYDSAFHTTPQIHFLKIRLT